MMKDMKKEDVFRLHVMTKNIFSLHSKSVDDFFKDFYGDSEGKEKLINKMEDARLKLEEEYSGDDFHTEEVGNAIEEFYRACSVEERFAMNLLHISGGLSHVLEIFECYR